MESIYRHRIQYWLLSLALVGAGLQVGCTQMFGLEQTELAQFQVQITAMGIVEPVNVRLLAADVEESLTIDGDGTFAFAATMPEGALYNVLIVDAPEECAVAGEAGTIQGGDGEVSLWCGLLDSLVLGGVRVPELDFASTQLTYRAQVSLLQETVTLTATGNRADVAITVAGQLITSGETSPPVPLGIGETDVTVVARHVPSGGEVGYVVTVDRAGDIVQAAYGKASNTDGEDWFGYSVALNDAGTILAVGAFNEDSAATGVGGDQTDNSAMNSGAVYIFTRDSTSWAQLAYLKASNTGAEDAFGASVALSASGDTLAVAARYEDSMAPGVGGSQADNSATDSGAVYIFARTGDSWTQRAYIKASNPGANDNFGDSVALSDTGDTLVVGARGEASRFPGVDGDETDNSYDESGAAYVFTRTDDTWSQEAYLKASNPVPSNFFGATLALSSTGDTLAVGAFVEDSEATGINGDQGNQLAASSGAVYIFTRSDTRWTQQAYIKASNTDAFDWLGRSLSLSGSGDTLAVGAMYEASQATGIDGNQADNQANDSGAVYVFERAATTWTQQAYIKASNTDIRDSFGVAVALSKRGDTLAVGALLESSQATSIDGDQADNFAPDSGAAYLFTRAGSSWTQQAYIKASNTGSLDYFGYSMALSGAGDTLVVGALQEGSQATGIDGNQANNSAFESGAIYIFH